MDASRIPLPKLLSRFVVRPLQVRAAVAILRDASADAGGAGQLSREVLAGVPELVRAIVALARDPAVPHRYRAGLLALIPWIAGPTEAIPVLGQMSDLAAVMLVLEWVARGIGEERLLEHWHPSPVMLRLFRRVAAL